MRKSFAKIWIVRSVAGILEQVVRTILSIVEETLLLVGIDLARG